MTLDLISSILLGYLLGSIPCAYLMVQWKSKKDIRQTGSGNVGALNSYLVTRSGLVGGAVPLLDMLKGMAAVALPWLFFDAGLAGGAAAGVASIIGHNFPIWLKFKGGKGVATFLGCLFGLYWPAGLAFCVPETLGRNHDGKPQIARRRFCRQDSRHRAGEPAIEDQVAVRCPNLDLKPVFVCTNRNASGIVRGFGGQEMKCMLIPILSLAMEKLDIDPFEFLKKNFVKPGGGYYWRDGVFYDNRGVDFTKAMDEGAKAFGWKEKWKGWLKPTAVNGAKRIGVGVGVHVLDSSIIDGRGISIDPEVNVPLVEAWRDRFGIERFAFRKARVQDVAAELNALPRMPTLVTFVHAHVDVDAVLGELHWDAAFTLACCVPGKQLTRRHTVWERGSDEHVLCASREYQVLVNGSS